jgi:hypothetical protein
LTPASDGCSCGFSGVVAAGFGEARESAGLGGVSFAAAMSGFEFSGLP